jgi:hypothetical protein
LATVRSRYRQTVLDMAPQALASCLPPLTAGSLVEATDLYLRAQALATDNLSEADCRRLEELLARLRLVLPRGTSASLQLTAILTSPPPL